MISDKDNNGADDDTSCYLVCAEVIYERGFNLRNVPEGTEGGVTWDEAMRILESE